MIGKHHRWLRKLLVLIIAGCAVIGLAWWQLPKCPLIPDDHGWSLVLRDRNGRVLHVNPAPDGRYRIWKKLDQISPYVVEGTRMHEDQRYYAHGGVELRSMMRAVWGVVTRQKYGGGSTITMQYARMRFGLRTRDIAGKCQQMLRALQLERHYSKDQILEAYLNCAPYGKNIEGVEAASLRWCGKSSSDLTVGEGVALVMIPQRPVVRCPEMGGGIDADTQRARVRLLKRMGYEDEMHAQYRWQVQAMPRRLMHLATRYDRGDYQLSLDGSMQRRVEERALRYIERQEELGVNNVAVLVVHAPSRQVRACLSSAGFFQDRIHGQIDGLRMKRSPGSLYKPFLYGLAMDSGLLYPDTLVSDAPAKWADYNPENYERDFLGPVKASDALVKSRNLPALQLMTQLKRGCLYDYLKNHGVKMENGYEHYGLSLVLGSAPATMEEIASLYAGLATDGGYRKIVYHGDSEAKEAMPISEGARWLVLDMLREREGQALLRTPSSAFLAIKTGTSQGFKDAWAVGVSGEYVVVVWLGDFRGASNPAFKGRTLAAPFVRDLMGSLGVEAEQKPVPMSVARVRVCSVSGKIVGEHCPHSQDGWYLPGVSSIQVCDLHRKVWVDVERGVRVSPLVEGKAIREEVMEFWSPEFMELFRQAGVPRREIPISEDNEEGRAPTILSPLAGKEYHLGAGMESLILKARGGAGVSRLFWFVDGQYVGSVVSEQVFEWVVDEGRHTIRLVDDQGRKSEVEVRVKRI